MRAHVRQFSQKGDPRYNSSLQLRSSNFMNTINTARGVLRSMVWFAIFASAAGWIIGCNPSGIDVVQGGGKDKSAAPGPMTTVAESDFNTDTQNLSAAEASLQSVGLKFQVQPGTPATASWDDSFRTNYHTQNPSAKPTDAVPALKAFYKAANDYVKKYSNAFHMTHTNGTDEIKTVDAAKLASLKAEADLAKAEAKKLNPKP
jgi:hypothetical protein